MNIEWLALRPFNGDIKNGFEELICQLARSESIYDRQNFYRVAAPDGGVEAYCTLSNGDEYGWQAKFFVAMGEGQWSQLFKSFKKTLLTHPNLKKYYICTPLDRQDPRIDNQEWFMDKWNKKTREWKEFASKSGREIEFEYWGNSEIFDRLSRSENEGKLYYWFNKDEFSDDWFDQRLEESIINIGNRYTPIINFDLPIAQVFEGLSRDNLFKQRFISFMDKLLKTYKKATSKSEKIEGIKDDAAKIKSLMDIFTQLYGAIDLDQVSYINQELFVTSLSEFKEVINKLNHQLYKLDDEEKRARKAKKEYVNDNNIYAWNVEYYRNFADAIDKFVQFLRGSAVSLSNNPFLILSGEAGIGKSHLLADIAVKRKERNQFTILLLGQQFSTTEDPWSQIFKLLQLDCKKETFLGALNAKGEKSQTRVLIFIDAINEGEGKNIWKNHMAGFIKTVQRFPYLGIVFSVRSSYQELLIPDVVKDNKLAVKITHHGFANHEYEASKLFFKNYKIKQPSIPLLHPEFSNPLFLKLFCEGLFKKGLHVIPDGYEGITTIINFLLDAINDTISDRHNQPRGLKIVHKIVKQIAIKVIETNNSYIQLDEAFLFITDMKEAKAIVDKSQFFKDLISEGLLTQNIYRNNKGDYLEGIYISYERFADHLVCSYLIEKYLNQDDPIKSFSKGSNLFEIVKDERAAYSNKGLIEAFCIQLPEIIGLELYEVAPYASKYEAVVTSFIESLSWRKKETLSDKLLTYINEIVIGKFGHNYYFLNTILLLTSQPDNYFNSNFLHKHLLKYTMAERDALWIPYTYEQFSGYESDNSAVRRIIDWAWNEDNRDNISDEAIFLMSQTILWFTTSSNRTLRDSATKALICLLEDRIHIVIHLLEKFNNINDPYVLQRLYAVAYGCAVRTSKTDDLLDLGNCIFKLVFATEYVIPDILLRDYAKSTIEYAVHKGKTFEFDLSKIQPPYKSDLSDEIPTDDEISELEFNYEDDNFQDYFWSQNSILDSMVTEHSERSSSYGDFGRYVFQHALSYWGIDVNALSNLAIKWIFGKYGYDVEKHGKFDRMVVNNNYGRHSHVVERIGKKYQWIAFYELLAMISDNYPFYGNSYSSDVEPIKYEGPWNPYVRDIDPTMVTKGNPLNKNNKFWWNAVHYDNWDLSNKDWIFKKDDLPDVKDLIQVRDDKGEEWLILEILHEWGEPNEIGEEDFILPKKRLVYDISSHLVRKKDKKAIIDYLENRRSIRGCGLSESSRHYQMFSREYYWGAANRLLKTKYYRGNDWDELYDRKTRKFVCETANTAIQFLWEEEYDASKEETINFYKPTEILFDLLDLHYTKIEGHFMNGKNELICFDPKGSISTLSCLLVRKNSLLTALTNNDLEIIWSSYGEKLIVGGSFRKEWVGRLNISDIVYFDEDSNLINTTFFEEE